jgi:arylsulfatase A-like enzyme
MFEKINTIEGNLTMKVSKASATSEWLRANVAGRNLRDTVYVTANPQLESNRGNWDINFHEIINVWLDDGWDEETGTVLAETMTDVAAEIHDQFPNKRIIVHYMQPHYPFVHADTEFDKEHLSSIKEEGDHPEGENIWNKKYIGEIEISHNRLWTLYETNLKYVLTHVKELLEKIDGKIVITSDHGNFVGERAFPIPVQEYGHPRGLYDDAVVRVPWLECTHGERREVTAGSDSLDCSAVQSEVISDRLHDLGYLE